VRDIAESAEVVHCQGLPVVGLIGCLALDGVCQGPDENVDGRSDRLALELSW
jgi:hypothetical protein